MKKHTYTSSLTWTGNTGEGTSTYQGYKRDYTIHIDGKSDILGSSDSSFQGDKNRHNPEELFIASLSSCHMLWYLHLCSVNGITVVEYHDQSAGVMIENERGAGRFESVLLKPVVVILESEKKELAMKLHKKANEMCFIANSCDFEVEHDPKISVRAD